VEAVFDAPVSPHGVGGGFGAEGGGGDIVSGVEAAAILELGARGDLDDGGDAGQAQFAGEAFVAAQPIDVAGDRDGAFLDPPMSFVAIGGGVESGGRSLLEEALDLAPPSISRRRVGWLDLTASR